MSRFLLALALLGAACSTSTREFRPSAPLRASGALTIRGSVFDQFGRAVTHALVHAAGESRESTWSNPDGTFTIIGLARGSYVLKASAKGFDDAEIVSQAGMTAQRLTIRYRGVVRGRVVDEGGVPVPAFLANGEPFVESDGRFVVARLEQGWDCAERGFVFIQAPNLAAQRIPEPVPDALGDLDLGDVVLTNGRLVTGTVTDARDGVPVGFAHLTVGWNPPRSSIFLCGNCSARYLKALPRDVVTATDGTFEFAHLPRDVSALVVTRRGGPFAPMVATLRPDQQKMSIRLEVGAALEGTLTGFAAAEFDTRVTLFREDPDSDALAAFPNVSWPSPSHTFRRQGLTAGHYWLVLQPEEKQGLLSHPERIELRAGEVTAVALAPTRDVRRLDMEFTPPFQFARFYLVPGEHPFPMSVVAQSTLAEISILRSNEPRFEGVPSGRYTLFTLEHGPSQALYRQVVDVGTGHPEHLPGDRRERREGCHR